MSKRSSRWEANHYRERALKHYGCVCVRCGNELPKKELVVHHKDLNNILYEMGNHSLDNLMVLCRPCHSKIHRKLEGEQTKLVGLPDVERGMHLILKGLKDEYGLDISSEHFQGTPKRVARAYAEIFSGVKNTDFQVQEVLSTSFSSDLDDMMLVKDTLVYSMCPHHFLPVVYYVDIAYIPDGQVLGLSKLPRVAEILASRPVIQEDLTVDIADALMSIKPKGVAVRICGQHFCMQMRGVHKPGSYAVTSCMRGIFMKDKAARQEFLSFLTSHKFTV